MKTERPERIEARKIFGLDLSKRTFMGCILDLVDPGPKPPVFNGREKMHDLTRSTTVPCRSSPSPHLPKWSVPGQHE